MYTQPNSLYTYTHIHTHIHTHTHTYTPTHIRTHPHTHPHTHTSTTGVPDTAHRTIPAVSACVRCAYSVRCCC